MSKELITKLLREYLLKEEMKPSINDSLIENEQEHEYLLIAKDDNNSKEHYLILSVDLMPNGKIYNYGYGFSVYDINFNKITPYM